MSTHDKDNDQGTDLPLDDAEHHNDQQNRREEPKVDDDPDMRVDGASPDFLAAPKRGKGVRRLNRLPLVIVGGVVALAVMGVTYTMYDRQQQQQAAANGTGEARTVGAVAESPVQPGPASAPPVPPEMPTDAGQSDAGQQSQGGAPVERGGQPQNTNSAPPQVSQAMQDRLQKIKQVEDRRFQLAMQSLDSDSSIEMGRQADRNANANGAAAPGMMPVSGQGRVSADELMNRYMAANGLAGGMGAGGPGFAGGGMGGMGGGGNSMAAENQQDRKQAFLANTPEAEVYLARQRKAAVAPSQEVKAGWVIPGVMISGINSDLPGQIIGQVREAVYDSATGTQCLIPPGSRVVGTYDSGVTLGQTRALAVWRRIIYPDGSSISIDNMPGTDMGGYAGFNDKVNNHYARIFGSGLLLSVFSAGIQLSQPQASNGENYSSSQIIAGSLGQQMGQIGMQMAQRNMNIQPTLEIRPGYEFNIMVTKDIILPTWEGHPMAGQSGKGCN
ncbi:conjugal transfer protein TrbI [Salmonella enterica subsp. enterica serovar Heidelberg]|uniref:TrbI/VirB10 family protein n=1 Tax=Enterobacter hormaechei TaxID=158836 RepID=UPI000698D8F6|nr:TrbI/VirB10 family protein [Enterobacter hormaechei]EHB3589577.1 conjugal transfer protein TrbI [Salmonella enterica subsp. enterica serovar Heidelberg]EHG6371805.1 conjugal transfer protein TrbI [Salmonella enterica subsp. enterica serovar Heidelberg]